MKSIYQEPNSKIYCGHALDILRDMPDESVDMVITSPPYWGLRTYKTEPIIWGENHCEHEWGSLIEQRQRGATKGATAQVGNQINEVCGTSIQQGNFCLKCHAWKGELGLEPTIELYIEHLILIFNEVKRVLKKTGTCWVNLDDSYAGSWGDSGHRPERDGVAGYQREKNTEWYGREGHPQFNPPTASIKSVSPKSLCLIPQRFAIAMVENGWILRNDIVWNKPNPMPESVKDRFTGSWEHLFFFVQNKRYYFERQFEPMAYPERVFNPNTENHAMQELRREGNRTTGGLHDGRTHYGNPELGRNKRDVWAIGTVPSPKHDGIRNFATFPESLCETPILAGCPQDGTVMDIFAGSGTTGAVAKRLGRKYIGIELNPDYCKLHVKRLQAISLPMELHER